MSAQSVLLGCLGLGLGRGLGLGSGLGLRLGLGLALVLVLLCSPLWSLFSIFWRPPHCLLWSPKDGCLA